MAEPHVDEIQRADEALAALKRVKPSSTIEARARAAELIRLEKLQLEAARKLTDTSAAKRIAGSKGNPQAPNWSKVIGEVAADTEDRLIKLMAQQIALRDRRLAALEASQLRDGGVWKEDKLFTPNMIVTYRGTLWLCLQETSTRPGNECWRLMTKSEGNR